VPASASYPTPRPGKGIRWDDLYVDQFAANIDDLNTRQTASAGAGTELGYSEIVAQSASFTTEADVSGLSVSFTLTSTRTVQLRASLLGKSSGAPDKIVGSIADAANVHLIESGVIQITTANDNVRAEFGIRKVLAAGAYTYHIRAQRTTAIGTCTINASATNPSYIQALDITP
jgi:hypothetical protein